MTRKSSWRISSKKGCAQLPSGRRRRRGSYLRAWGVRARFLRGVFWEGSGSALTVLLCKLSVWHESCGNGCWKARWTSPRLHHIWNRHSDTTLSLASLFFAARRFSKLPPADWSRPETRSVPTGSRRCLSTSRDRVLLPVQAVSPSDVAETEPQVCGSQPRTCAAERPGAQRSLMKPSRLRTGVAFFKIVARNSRLLTRLHSKKYSTSSAL